MADHIAPTDLTTTATPDRLLAASTTWSPASFASDAEFELGYESAHPWALGAQDDHATH